MRRAYIAVVYAILLTMSTVAAASPRTIEQLFNPSPLGCLAAEAGAFDLSVKVTPDGAQQGVAASGLVSGFQPGDVLGFVRTSKSGRGGLRDTLSLAALVPGQPGRISIVFALDDVAPKAPGATIEDRAQFVVPPDGATWAFFTSSAGDGEGEYTVTVRCEPSSPSRSAPIS